MSFALKNEIWYIFNKKINKWMPSASYLEKKYCTTSSIKQKKFNLKLCKKLLKVN